MKIFHGAALNRANVIQNVLLEAMEGGDAMNCGAANQGSGAAVPKQQLAVTNVGSQEKAQKCLSKKSKNTGRIEEMKSVIRA